MSSPDLADPRSMPARRNCVILLLIPLWFLAGLKPALAQIGNNNPTGPAGAFNGSITSGCRYDPATGNATREVTDLTIPTVGAYPLAFTRISNSRASTSTVPFGLPGAWEHSYDWFMVQNISSGQRPSSYEAIFPDGRDETFYSSGGPVFGKGIRERVTPLNTSTMLTYLVLPDGGMVEFATTRQPFGAQFLYVFTATALIDPYGQRTTIAYDPVYTSLVTQVTEPGGRYIQLLYTTIYDPNGGYNRVVLDHITGSDGRMVQYSYQALPQPISAVALTGVTYFGDNTIQATYTYQPANVNPSNNFPLLATCDDPMYAGPMKKISYSFAVTNSDSTIPVAVGQLDSEKSGTTGEVVSQLVVPIASPAGSKRTEIRGDTKSRSFTYSTTGFIQSFTDFNGVSASQGYNSNGFLNFYKDRRGNQTDLTRDSTTGNITSITFPLTPNDTPTGTPRGTMSYVYGSSTCPDPNNKDGHYLYSATDEAGHTTIYLRDTSKRVVTINYPDGGTETFTYNSYGEVLTHKLKAGGTETNAYYLTANGDPSYKNGLVKEYRDAYHTSGNANVRSDYDTYSRLSVVTDAFGTTLGDANHSTGYAYNSRGQVTTTTRPTDPVDGTRHTVINAYDNPTGNLMSVTDELNHQTSYIYDDYHRMRSMTSPGHDTPVTTNYFYDTAGTSENYKLTPANVTFLKLPAGEVTNTTYDNNLRKYTVTAGYGTSDAATTQFGYDPNGNLTSVTDPRGHPSSTVYDERDRVMSTTDMLSNITSFKYDAGGRKASITRANGQVTTFDTYDSMNRLTQQTVKQTPDPDAVTKYGYYPSGLLQTMQDPHLVAIGSTYAYNYLYDLMGRKTQLTYPPDAGSVQRTELWQYDNVGNGVLSQFTNRGGKVQTLTYDSFNRVTLSHWNDSGLTPDVTTVYDPASRVTKVTNANATIVRAYFNDNLLKTETTTYADNVARPVNYTYDADGRRASLTGPSTYYFTYTYTARSLVDHINTSTTTAADYDYDLNGNVTKRTLANSTYSTYGYDWMNRSNSISHFLVGGTKTLAYSYDSVGNRQWVKRDGNLGDAYAYDSSDAATAVKLNIANPDAQGAAGPQTIVYEANGNRTSFAAYGTTDTYTSNALNQYSSRNSSQAVYDANGNMTTGLDGSVYTYDAQNRVLTAQKGASSTLNTYKYDGLNRQVSRKVGTASVLYRVYDGWDLLSEHTSGSLPPSESYCYGPTGLVENAKRSNFYYQDASGSSTHLASSTGALLEYYLYDLQGKPTFYSATGTQLTDSANNVRHLFTGQQWYNSVQLYDLRNRFYSPDGGRFLQADAAGFGGDATNLYRYCGNNALTFFDPDGLGAVPVPGGYIYRANPGMTGLTGSGQYIGNTNLRLSGQCGTGGQFMAGGSVGGTYHDVPSTRSWQSGPAVDSSTTPGTLVATGWTPSGSYPGLSSTSYPTGQMPNHVGIFVGTDNGNIVVVDQYTNRVTGAPQPIDQRTYSNTNQQWHEVFVPKGSGPYDPSPSSSYPTSNGAAAGEGTIKGWIAGLQGGYWNANAAGVGWSSSYGGNSGWGLNGQGPPPPNSNYGAGQSHPVGQDDGSAALEEMFAQGKWM